MEGKGRFGRYGGQYVPETLMNALIELEDAYADAARDPVFEEELTGFQSEYAGRPTPLTFCRNMSRDLGLAVYLKREDLVHGGSHKLNNTLGQALLAKRMGKKRLIAETVPASTESQRQLPGLRSGLTLTCSWERST